MSEAITQTAVEPTRASSPTDGLLASFMAGELDNGVPADFDAPKGAETPAPPVSQTPVSQTPIAPAATPEPQQVSFEPSMFDEEVVIKPPAAPQPPAKPAARVFDGLLPDEVPLFRDMGNASYAKLYPLYLEHKQLLARKAQVDRYASEHDKLTKELTEARSGRLYEHEDAWQLDPGVREAASRMQQFTTEADYWTEQLAKIEAGEPFRPLVQGPDGKPVVHNEDVQPTPKWRADVTRAMQNALLGQQRWNEQFTQRREQFSAGYKNYNGKIQAVRDQILKPYEKFIAPQRQQILSLFPALAQARPEVVALAEALALVNHAGGYVAKLQAQIKALQSNATAAAGNPAVPPQNGFQTTDAGDTEAAVKAMQAMTKTQMTWQ